MERNKYEYLLFLNVGALPLKVDNDADDDPCGVEEERDDDVEERAQVLVVARHRRRQKRRHRGHVRVALVVGCPVPQGVEAREVHRSHRKEKRPRVVEGCGWV